LGEKIALISEQQKGKTTTVNRQLIGKISSPEELENKAIDTLKAKI
jgi:hypothetical protein